jgi:hypothetical protein
VAGGVGPITRRRVIRPAPHPLRVAGRPRPLALLHDLCACRRFDGSLSGASTQGVTWSNVCEAPSHPKWVMASPQIPHGISNTTRRFNR